MLDMCYGSILQVHLDKQHMRVWSHLLQTFDPYLQDGFTKNIQNQWAAGTLQSVSHSQRTSTCTWWKLSRIFCSYYTLGTYQKYDCICYAIWLSNTSCECCHNLLEWHLFRRLVYDPLKSFVQHDPRKLVCNLNRSLYGLQQSTREHGQLGLMQTQ